MAAIIASPSSLQTALSRSCSSHPLRKSSDSIISSFPQRSLSSSFFSSTAEFALPTGENVHKAVTNNYARKRSSIVVTASVGKKKVLIVNTNGGGHAVIGFWLSRQLANAGHEVSILTVGEESSEKMKKQPFNRYGELRSLGVKTIWGDPSNLDASAARDLSPFDVVVDNNGKNLEGVKPVIDWAKSNGAKQFLFVSSAGIYKTTDYPPHVEGDAIKTDAGHALVEDYLSQVFSRSLGLSWSSFRPQYITGSGNNKDCEEWFFDRLVRGRPIPIPAPGNQLTVIAHASDIANMMTEAVNQAGAASGQIFNAVGDRAVTFDGLVRMCAKAANVSTFEIVHYEPKKVEGLDAKKAFPFRNMHFYAEPRAAKKILSIPLSSFSDLQTALNSRYLDYVANKRDKKEVKFDADDKILKALGRK